MPLCDFELTVCVRQHQLEIIVFFLEGLLKGILLGNVTNGRIFIPNATLTLRQLKPFGYRLCKKTWFTRSLLTLYQEKASCKNFLVVEEKNHSSVDPKRWLYAVGKNQCVNHLVVDGVCWCAAVWRWTFQSLFSNMGVLWLIVRLCHMPFVDFRG